MTISSLTAEKVARLLQQRTDKEAELNRLLQLTSKDLWNRDLDALSDAWQELLDEDTREEKEDQAKKKKGPSGKFAKGSKKRASDAFDGEYVEKKAKVPKIKSNS